MNVFLVNHQNLPIESQADSSGHVQVGATLGLTLQISHTLGFPLCHQSRPVTVTRDTVTLPSESGPRPGFSH